MRIVSVLRLLAAVNLCCSVASAEAVLHDPNEDLELTADALVPRNGAELAILSGETKGLAPLQWLQNQKYSKEKVLLSRLSSGAVVCLKTSDGQYVKMEVLGVNAQKGAKGASSAKLKMKRTLYSSDGTEIVQFSGAQPQKDPKAVVQFGAPPVQQAPGLDFNKPAPAAKPEPEPEIVQPVRGAPVTARGTSKSKAIETPASTSQGSQATTAK